MDKSTLFVRDLNKRRIGNIHGPWTMKGAPPKLGFAPLAIYLGGLTSWIDLGEYPDSCISSPSKCSDGMSVSFKASVTGIGTGYLLSSGGVAVYYVNGTMRFTLQDQDRVWEVKGSYRKHTWQTFSMSWSRANGLIAVIAGDASDVLRDPNGKTVTPPAVLHTTVTIGRPNNETAKYAQGAIRDFALWEEEISEERMSKLHVSNGEF